MPGAEGVVNPYLIQGPALISFSGGRTSGYMLKHILDAHGGTLPADVHVTFANTGREMPETLDFVQECSERWGVRIVWLEFDPRAEHKTAIVNHNSASRNGEPLAAIITERKVLPNPTMRFCTIEAKIRRQQKYATKVLGYDAWANVVGLRADEMSRVEKQITRFASGKDGKAKGRPLMPLADAGVSKRDVGAWWSAQPFDLHLPNINGSTPDGNCDLCFLKQAVNIQSTMRRRPETAAWWIEQEAKHAGRGNHSFFRQDRPAYVELLKFAQTQTDLFAAQEESLDCACTD
ncbi:phosphoadenosine phosphosulfate reductase [Methylorubrum extorquens CM4]|uniref:Phosphoadenosine phosphosulfate reductase n=2 Tax=Methylorubrum extorquens TaxID=408 RepID=B7KY25_METC4|nr:phosphoadenosine phosphosulfate reductase [Methylorubrum extorquens CM4]